jgi:hypothetical protein
MDGLPLPKRLRTLIDGGFWPRTAEEERQQNIRSLVAENRIHLFAPDENRLYLLRPPFRTVAERMTGAERRFWMGYGALHEISPELCLQIAAFQIGSDSAVVLDYTYHPADPAVIRLKWQKPKPNTWTRCADSFDEFADMLSLEVLP